ISGSTSSSRAWPFTMSLIGMPTPPDQDRTAGVFRTSAETLLSLVRETTSPCNTIGARIRPVDGAPQSSRRHRACRRNATSRRPCPCALALRPSAEAGALARPASLRQRSSLPENPDASGRSPTDPQIGSFLLRRKHGAAKLLQSKAARFFCNGSNYNHLAYQANGTAGRGKRGRDALGDRGGCCPGRESRR